jgi:hypothetical protein
MIDDLKPLLQDFPEPPPPSSITATVMARIARDVERRAEDQVTAPERRASDVAAWACTTAGVLAVVTLCFVGWVSSGAFPDLTSARIGLGRPSLIPVGGPLSMLMGLGLLVYLAGLFAPLRNGRRE